MWAEWNGSMELLLLKSYTAGVPVSDISMIEMHTHKQRGCSVALTRSIDFPNFPTVGAEQRE
jgi:hypothetical protein